MMGKRNNLQFLLFLVASAGILVLGGWTNTPASKEKCMDGIANWNSVDSTARIVGDFDGNGVKEALLLYPVNPRDHPEDRYCILYSRDPQIHEHKIMGTAFSAHLEWEGDLNGDHGDEIGVLMDNSEYCNNTYHLLSYQQGAWRPALPPFVVSCKVFDDPSDIIRPIAGQKGWVEVLGAVHNDEGAGLSPHYKKRKLEAAGK
jgi:hypothetical protein